MKKILAILLTVCMVVCMIPGAAFAADPPAGTEADPILIDSYNTFKGIIFEENKYYKQTGNFVIPSGDTYAAKELKGTYDGSGYTITLDDENLFSTVSGTVKNLKVTGTAGKNIAATGAIAATNSGTIEDCTVSNVTLTQSTANEMGAVTGSSTGTIKNCAVSSVALKNETENATVTMGGLTGKASGIIECGSISGITFTAKANDGNKIGSVVGTASEALTIVSAKEIGAYPVIAEDTANEITIASSGKLNNELKITKANINNTNVNKLTGSTIKLNSANITNVNTITANAKLEMASSNVSTLNLGVATEIEYKDGNSHIGTINCDNSNTPSVTTNAPNLKVDKCVYKNDVASAVLDAAKLQALFNGANTYNYTYDSQSKTYTYTPVYAAAIGTQEFYTLDDAIKYALANSGKTIKLLKEATVSSITVQNGTAVTIDANGKNLTLSSVTNYGSLAVADTAVVKGKITISSVASGSNKFCGTGNYTSDPTENMLDGYTCTQKKDGNTDYWEIDDTKKDISKLTVTLSDNTMAYTGYQLKPTVTVKDGVNVVSSTEYDVTYGANIGSSKLNSTGYVTVTFKSTSAKYRGTKTLQFTIIPGKVLSTTTVYIPAIADQAYTGTYVKPYVSVYYGGPTSITAKTLLTENVHYTLSYSSNINAGTATVTATAKAGSGYSGSVSKTFAIKYNLSNATVTTTPATYAYDGRIKQPAVTVKIGYVTVPSSDYIVTYSNNLKVGTATATVTAKTYGTSMGSNSAYFTITGKDGVITPEYAEYSKKTTKSNPFAIKIVSNTTDGTGYSYTSSDTSVATVSANGTVTPVGCGRTVITITTTGNRAYNPATATVTVTVKPTKGIVTSLKSTGKGKMVVRYKKESPNASYYQISYGRAGNYDIRTVKNSSAPTGKSTIKGLQSDKKYFIKVRGVKELADGTVLYGSWSKVKNAVTK